MHRVHPKESLSIPPEDASKVMDSESDLEERKEVKEFTWEIGLEHFAMKLGNRQGRPSIYFLDGRVIEDENYLRSVTKEICKEYGFDLLDTIADLVLPIGFGYGSLIKEMPKLVDDAFKPVSRIRQRKTIIWVEDDHWSNPQTSVLEPLVQKILLNNAEPFVMAPSKYFDKEVMAVFSKRMLDATSLDCEEEEDTSGDPEDRKSSTRAELAFWKTMSVFVKFGFLLALRGVLHSSPIIILQFGQKVNNMINAVQLLDLADAEGHQLKYLKNIASNSDERKKIVDDFVKMLKGIPNLFPIPKPYVEPEPELQNGNYCSSPTSAASSQEMRLLELGAYETAKMELERPAVTS